MSTIPFLAIRGGQEAMPTIRRFLAIVPLLLGPTLPSPVFAQEPSATRPVGAFPKLEALNAAYQAQRRDLERRRISDLGALAEKAQGPEASAAYRQLFGLAIAEGLCGEATVAAGRCLASASADRDARALATLVQVLARAEKGEHDRALGDLKALFHRAAGGGGAAAQQLDPEMALAVGEAFLQRLLHDGRYDVAQKLCDLACEGEAPALLKEHFEDRMARLDLVGKAAPPIAGTDVDGKSVSLADLKGKVVLIDFWATWCPPCVASMPALSTIAQKYHDQGFVILGVNVDAMHEDVKEAKTALQTVRRFLVKHRVAWVNVLNGEGTSDFAAAYRVEQIPANFLVDRDGKIVAVEQNGEMLERAIMKALAHQ
jgi:thiol-disulfide isomerase/thioredoxin